MEEGHRLDRETTLRKLEEVFRGATRVLRKPKPADQMNAESLDRSMDRLPPSVTEPLQRALVGRLDQATLVHAFRAATDALIEEIGYADARLAARLKGALLQMPQDALGMQTSR